ncbi:sialidase family protein [Kitasatospora aureofaciens]|uniref:sialidase family protein n=1 Tax=Kitasatospora aureofaciens TaxID=1894 RepID=UPI0005279F92|nr:sialidase family protein [Kitasatospora aureofaciens]
MRARPGRLRSLLVGLCAGATVIALTTGPAQAAPAGTAVPAGPAARADAAYAISTPTNISAPCSGQNAETIQAVDPAVNAVYDAWMGCKGIGFAGSRDGGSTFGSPLTLPGSTGQNGSRSWDPAITVAPDGAIYVAFMVARSGLTYPVVDVSTDHGASFKTAGQITPPDANNWGDRDFVTAGPDGTLYLTWDYGPSAAAVTFVCAASGSCSFATGDVNAVLQKSTDGGRTWSAMSHISPGYPNSGADSAPVTVEADGSIDVLYQGYVVTDVPTDNLTVAHTYATRSTDGGATWSPPVRVGGGAGSMNNSEWWIDGSEALGPDGTLYATWDTQGSNSDTGWLSYSRDHGATWSTPGAGALRHAERPARHAGRGRTARDGLRRLAVEQRPARLRAVPPDLLDHAGLAVRPGPGLAELRYEHGVARGHLRVLRSGARPAGAGLGQRGRAHGLERQHLGRDGRRRAVVGAAPRTGLIAGGRGGDGGRKAG